MEISLNGGIIIIGSLYWDDNVQRVNWRNESLDLENQILVKVPIIINLNFKFIFFFCDFGEQFLFKITANVLQLAEVADFQHQIY